MRGIDVYTSYISMLCEFLNYKLNDKPKIVVYY